MAKKIFFFSLSLLVLVLIFLGAYNLVFKNNVRNPIADATKKTFQQGTENTPFIAAGMAESPINELIFGASLGEDGFLYYYSLDDQALKKATTEGKDKVILMSNLPGEVTRLLWSPKKDRVLLLLKQSSGNIWYSAELANKTLVPLKSDIGRLAWDNFGSKIFYQYTDPATHKRSLNVASPDGSQWKKLNDMGSDDYYLSAVPNSSQVSFWSRPTLETATSLEVMGIAGEGRHALSSPLYGADFLWSPNGEQVLVSGSDTTTGQGFSLRLINRDGVMKNIAVPTLLSKVTWSTDNHTLYFALPGSLPDGTRLPDDYYAKSLHSKDTFWKIDTDTGKKTRLVELKDTTQVFDSSDPFLSPKEDALYFTDRVTKRLYRIDL